MEQVQWNDTFSIGLNKDWEWMCSFDFGGGGGGGDKRVTAHGLHIANLGFLFSLDKLCKIKVNNSLATMKQNLCEAPKKL